MTDHAQVIRAALGRLTGLRNDATARGANWRAVPVYCGITNGRAEAVRDPRLAHSNWLHVSLWNGDPLAGVPPVTFPNGMPAGQESPYDIPLENAAWIGRLCRDGGVIRNREGEPVPFVAGAPIVVDFEGSYHDPKTNGPLPPEKYAKLGLLSRTIRENAAPGQVIALNAISPFVPTTQQEVWRDGKGPTPELFNALVAGYEPYRPLVDEVDVLIADFCIGAPASEDPTAADRNLGSARYYIEALRKAFGKPAWGLLDSNYRNRLMLMEMADVKRNMADARRDCDGVWVWSGKRDYDATYGAN